MGPEQMHDDELFRCRIRHHLFKRRQHVGVVLARALGALLVHIELLVGLLRKDRQHGVAGGHRLLVGDPEGLIPGLLHHVHQRRFGQVEVRILFVRKGQRLLQDLNSVGA